MKAIDNRPAFLIDMDGLLLDTERLSHLSWKAARDELGLTIDDSVFYSIIGKSMTNIEVFFSRFLLDEQVASDLIRVASIRYKELIQSDALRAKVGARRFLEKLKHENLKRCLVTSTERALAIKKLETGGLGGLLREMVCGDDVLHSKPDPEIYLKAARTLGLPASECIAFEDSANGVRAALTAGCRVIHVPDMVELDAELTACLYRKYDTLDDFMDEFDGLILMKESDRF